MNSQGVAAIVITSICCLSGQIAAATFNVSPTAPTVHLRTNCTEGASPGVTQANCFTTTPELESWIENIRKPNANSPLKVEIGPGRFEGFTCPNGVSNITLSGAGPENTFIGSLITSAWGIQTKERSTSCSELAVNELTSEGFFWGVLWRSSGNTRWNNVTIRGLSYGWFDFDCPANTRGKHYIFSSRIISTGGALGNPTSKGYGSNCGENWFFGSEIVATGLSENGAKGLYLNNSEAHVYGGVIRVIASPGLSYVNAGTSSNNPSQQEGKGLFAVLSANNSEIHIHGTGIDVIGNALPNNIAALIATSGGSIHANETAYNLKTGAGGVISRIIDENEPLQHKVHAPFLWAPHVTPPNVVSTDGSDLAVVNEVTAQGSPSPKFVIYNNACTSRWFDVGTNACRP